MGIPPTHWPAPAPAAGKRQSLHGGLFPQELYDPILEGIAAKAKDNEDSAHLAPQSVTETGPLGSPASRSGTVASNESVSANGSMSLGDIGRAPSLPRRGTMKEGKEKEKEKARMKEERERERKESERMQKEERERQQKEAKEAEKMRKEREKEEKREKRERSVARGRTGLMKRPGSSKSADEGGRRDEDSGRETGSAMAVAAEPIALITDTSAALEVGVASHAKRQKRKDRPKGPVSCACDHKGLVNIEDKKYPMGFELYKDYVYSRRKDIGKGGFMITFLQTKRNVKNLCMSDWTPPGAEAVLKSSDEILQSEDVLDLHTDKTGWHRRVEYILPLAIPLGPKQTRCVISEEIVANTPYTLCVRSTTQNPDIFDGFKVIARFCLSYYGKRVTRQLVSASVDFWKFTVIKIPIQNGAYDGVRSNCVSLFAALAEEVDEGNCAHAEAVTDEDEGVAKSIVSRSPSANGPRDTVHHLGASRGPTRVDSSFKQPVASTPDANAGGNMRFNKAVFAVVSMFFGNW
ncbi:hypothetical protein HK101_006527 [Irineochytrium annulatum]|nr:hypothetical protein HK101_006527 [Irineochytrium annulatum]